MAKKKSAKKKTTKASKKKAAVNKKSAAKKSTRKSSGSKGKAKSKSAQSAARKKTTRSSTRKSTAKSASRRSSAGKASKSGRKKTSGGSSKNKSPLTKKQLKEFQDLLLEKRRSILGDISGMAGGSGGRSMQESSGDLSNMPTHPADIGSDNYEYEFNLGLMESERIMLDEISEALERIERGTYGICLGTGEPIGLPRLRARPWCKYCIEYQRKIEKGLVRPEDDQNQNEEEPESSDIEDEDEELLEDESVDKDEVDLDYEED